MRLCVRLRIRTRATHVPVNQARTTPHSICRRRLTIIRQTEPFRSTRAILRRLPMINTHDPLRHKVITTHKYRRLSARTTRHNHTRHHSRQLVKSRMEYPSTRQVLHHTRDTRRNPTRPIRNLVKANLSTTHPENSLLVDRYKEFTPRALTRPLTHNVTPVVNRTPRRVHGR